jgi:hypothetical protein
VPHRLRKAILKKGCKLGNGGWVRRGPQPQLGGMRRQRPTLDASQVIESGSVRGWRRGSQGKTPTREGLLVREEAAGEKFFEQLWRILPPHPARVRQISPI